MPKNFKKLLVCIVATFGITAMVFSCCKKIGLCASSGSTVYSDFPLPISSDYGGFSYSQEDYDSIFSTLESKGITPILLYGYEVGGYWNLKAVFTYGSNADVSSYSISKNNNGTLGYGFSTAWVRYDGFTTTVGGGYDGASTVNYSNWFTTSPSGSSVLPENTFLFGYPLALNSQLDGKVYFSDGSLAFEVPSSSPIISGHTKGGVLSNYIDSDDLLENSSDLPKVDTSAPSNSSSIPDWLQKILNALGRVNQSIQGGVLTIGDYIGSMTEKIGEWFQNTIDSIEGFFGRVEDKLDDIIDSIQDLFDGTTVSQAQSVWEQEFNNSVFKDFVDLKSTIETDILTPIKNANAPSTLSFTIPLISVNVPRLVNSGGHVSTVTNNVYLFGQSVTLDFSWYSRSISGGVFNGSSIRDYLVPIIATFLYVGMVVHLLFKIPSFLNGSSGFSNTLHSVVVSNNGSKFKKA